MAGKKSALTRAVARAGAGLPAGYASFLDGLKARIRAAQVKAALAVNAELVLLYWRIGRDILARQQREGWGARVIDRLSAELAPLVPLRPTDATPCGDCAGIAAIRAQGIHNVVCACDGLGWLPA